MPSMLRTPFPLFAALALLLLGSFAHAQSHAAHKKAAYAAFELGRYSEAISEFEKAYALKRDPRLLYNLGLAYYRRYELHGAAPDIQQARHLFRRFLLFVPPPRRGADRQRILAARSYAEEFLRKIEAALRQKPRPMSQPASKPTLPQRNATPRATPLATSTPTSVPTPLPDRPRPPRRGPLAPWVLYGVAVAAGAAAGITGAMALAADGRSDDLAADANPKANAEAARAKDLALATDLLLGGAILSALTGVALHLWLPGPDSGPQDESVRLQVLVGVNGAALRLRF